MFDRGDIDRPDKEIFHKKLKISKMLTDGPTLCNDEAPPTAQRAPPPRFSNFQPYASIRRPVGTTTLLGMLRSYRYTALSPLPQLGGSSTPTLFLTGFISAGWFLHPTLCSHRLSRVHTISSCSSVLSAAFLAALGSTSE